MRHRLAAGSCSDLGGCVEEGLVIFPDQGIRIVIATKPIKFRKGHDALALKAQAELGFLLTAGVKVVFRSRRKDRVKALFWVNRGRAAGPSDHGARAGSR